MGSDEKKLHETVDAIHKALLGDLEGNPGLIGETRMLKKDMRAFREKLDACMADINTIKEAQTFSKGKQAGILGSAGVIGAAFVKLFDFFTQGGQPPHH